MPKFRLPPLNALRAFELAGRHQSVKRAAIDLSVTQSAVSHHIRNLEKIVGRRLFERRNRKIILTDAGEILLAAVSQGLDQIHRAFTQLRSNSVVDRLIISVDPDFANLCLVPRLADFYDKVSGILVEIRSERMALTDQAPRASCSIQYAEAGIKTKNVETLFRSSLFPVCAAALFQRSPIRKLADVRGHVLLHDHGLEEWQEYLRPDPAAVSIDVHKGVIFSDSTMCMDAAVRGQGVAMGDDYLAAIYLAENRLVRLFTRTIWSKNACYLIRPEGAPVHPSVNVFRDWLLAAINAVPSAGG